MHCYRNISLGQRTQRGTGRRRAHDPLTVRPWAGAPTGLVPPRLGDLHVDNDGFSAPHWRRLPPWAALRRRAGDFANRKAQQQHRPQRRDPGTRRPVLPPSALQGDAIQPVSTPGVCPQSASFIGLLSLHAILGPPGRRVLEHTPNVRGGANNLIYNL